MVYSGILIAFLGFGVWAHHMFAVGMGPIADSVFAVTTMLIAVPTGVKIFNWIFTMWGGNLRFTVAMKYAIALVALFTIGGISGVMHASPPADLQQTDTYFVVAHIHYVLFTGSMFGIFAGIYHYYPKMFGRLMDERLGKLHFWLTFAGAHVTFFPMHFSGLSGMPRRIYTYDAGQGYTGYNAVSTAGYGVLLLATLVFVYNFLRSRTRGTQAGTNPWGAGTLEWSIPSPPPDYNFAELPRVTSRYPLWDVRRPAPTTNAHDVPTATELGISMPNPSILPLVCAVGVVVMFSGLFFLEASTALGVGVMVGGALWWVSALVGWLTTPLEDPR
jgi:cytochrome c oxidase subunit 1